MDQFTPHDIAYLYKLDDAFRGHRREKPRIEQPVSPERKLEHVCYWKPIALAALTMLVITWVALIEAAIR